MSDKFTVSFEMSNEDIPVLLVMREGYGSYVLSTPTMNIKKVITGDKAQQLYEELTKKEESDDKEH